MRIGQQILAFERQLINSVNSANAATQLSSLRIATGRRINRPSDDPSGFFALSQFERELSVVNSSMKNVDRATNTVTQIQSTLGQIRDQIHIIRDAAQEDVGGLLTAGERAVNQTRIDAAITAINKLANGRINGQQLLNKVKLGVVGTTDKTDISPLNASQIEDFQVNSIDSNTSVVLSGSVTAAKEAELTYAGGAGATVQSTATFSLTGGIGTANVAITQGESLVAVRDRVNQASATTGVVASVNGDDLVFKSTETGANAHIEVQAVSVDADADGDVSGVNPLQIVSFTVDSIDPASSITLTGRVRNKAERGELAYDSNNGSVKRDATFTLSGNLGSATITVTRNESITGVRDRINSESANTGVVASISDDDIVLNSAEYGSSEFVNVEVISGRFDITGGARSGAQDYGKDARAQINGTDYYGDGNQFSNLTLGPGTFTFEFAPEYETDFDDITITSSPGVFNITGGNGDGTADGNDAQAIINGQNVTASGGQFTLATGSGNFTVDFVDGFSGAFDPITVTRADVDIIGATGEDSELGFSLFGDRSSSSLKVKSVTATALGGVTGSLSDLIAGGSKGGLADNAANALAIADEALDELNLSEARINAFSNSMLASAQSLNASMQANIEQAIAQLNGVDEAKEVALMNKNLLLANNAQAAMSIFYEHRQKMTSMLLKMAGLA